MEVINLGNFGQKRPSPISGMSEALQQGLRTGAEQGKNVAEIQNMQATRAYQKQEMKIRQAELTRQIHKDEFDEKLKSAEAGRKTAEGLSVTLHGMNAQTRATTLSI